MLSKQSPEPFSSWVTPARTDSSYITGLMVSNSLNPGKLAEFIPISGKLVKWYMCGPTVYDHAHLGHARTYLTFDMIRRVMRDYFRYDVMLTMNITNIDDKIIIRSNETGQKFEEFASFWENDFFEDMKKLGIQPPEVVTRVSEYVDKIILYIQKIIERGFAYESNGSVYFDVESYRKSEHVYGKLAPNSVGDLEKVKEGEGSLTENNEKKSPFDFVLWKRSKANEPKWVSPWGEGRPGWHIECSVMASSTLGEHIDMHSGGVDLKFPHHENEIAQTEAFHDHKHDKQWVNYFLHSGHLNIDGLKMSKSLKNFITIKGMLRKYTPREMRLLFLTHKYDSLMDYMPSSDELDPSLVESNPKYKNQKGSMGQIQELDRKYSEFFMSVKANLRQNPIHKGTQAWVEKDDQLQKEIYDIRGLVHKHLCNNFDTPSVLKELEKIMSLIHIYMAKPEMKFPLLKSASDYVKEIFNLLGLNYESLGTSSSREEKNAEETVEPVFDAITRFRNEIRTAAKTKDLQTIFKLCDRLRDEDLPKLGAKIEDKPDGSSIWKFTGKN